jgi:hypothetical protein
MHTENVVGFLINKKVKECEVLGVYIYLFISVCSNRNSLLGTKNTYNIESNYNNVNRTRNVLSIQTQCNTAYSFSNYYHLCQIGYWILYLGCFALDIGLVATWRYIIGYVAPNVLRHGRCLNLNCRQTKEDAATRCLGKSVNISSKAVRHFRRTENAVTYLNPYFILNLQQQSVKLHGTICVEFCITIYSSWNIQWQVTIH